MKNRVEYAAVFGTLEIDQPALVRIVDATTVLLNDTWLVTTLPVIRVLPSMGLFETANTIYRPMR